MNKSLLQINRLSTSFLINEQFYPAVDDVSFDVRENEIMAIVGESGCGKSALALSVLGLHNERRTKMDGEIIYKGTNLIQQSPAKMNKIRGKEIEMIFQEPLTGVNSRVKGFDVTPGRASLGKGPIYKISLTSEQSEKNK